MTSSKEKGQYFTTNTELQNKVIQFIRNNPKVILEPSVGRGDLVFATRQKLEVAFDMYEIDPSIDFIINDKYIIIGDFLKQDIRRKYTTIIGNPPYVRTQKGNLYIDFIQKCVNLLEPNGELIFIVPSDFMKLTSASKLLNHMLSFGTFTDIYHPHNENLFENAAIDVIVFRYCLNKNLPKKVVYNDTELFINNCNGLITFSDNHQQLPIISDLFDAYVGLVTGKEEIYKNELLGNISVLNDLGRKEKYILIKQFPCDNSEINQYLLSHKETLINRKIKKFNQKNWFEWGAPRNIKIMEDYKNQDCIYVRTMTRNQHIAFLGTIDYFGGGLIMLRPKKENINLSKVLNSLNSDTFKKNFMYSGRFKIGHRQILNSSIQYTNQ